MLILFILSCIFLIPANCQQCGAGSGDERSFARKIFAGVKGSPEDFPWLARILYRWGNQHCGGVLIDNNIVLTAAHCVDKKRFKEEYLIVIVRGKTQKIVEIIEHPDYNYDEIDYDISLIVLANEMNKVNQTKSICLPVTRPIEKSICVIAGWGQYREGKFYPYNYHEELLPIVPMNNCNNKSAYDGELNEETQLCAGYMTKSAKLAPGVCNGDSGSPLMCFKSGKWEVQGIASKSRACGSATFPGVFTYVKAFVPWIRSNLAVLKRPSTVSQFDEPNDYSKSPFYLKSKLSLTKKQSPKKSEPPSYQKYLPKDDSKFYSESSEYAEPENDVESVKIHKRDPEPYPDYESEEEYR